MTSSVPDPADPTTTPTALSIAQALIRCPSVTPAEGGALATLQDLLDAHGFVTNRVVFSAPGTPDVDNLYARIGTGAPYLLFAGHTDVVPTGDVATWQHAPFAAIIEDGLLYGRGAQDMKSGVAALVAASLAHIAAHGPPNGSIGFLITGDEEGPAINGTIKLVEWAHARGERFDHCIVGEPTSREKLGDMIKVGRRGSLTGHVTVFGRQGHVAYPANADNPIPATLRILQALLAPLDDGTALFQASNLEVVSVDVGNRADNVIPAKATATFNIRFNDAWTAETLAAELKQRAETAAPDANFDVTFEPCNAPSFVTQPSPFTELVCDAVEAELGRRPELSTGGGTSDARFIQHYCPVLEMGLVGNMAHMVDERVPVDELERLASIYRRIIAAYFG